jgi:hypothetical protein
MASVHDERQSDQAPADQHSPIDVEASERAAVAYFATFYGVAPVEVPTIGPSLKDDLWQATAFNAERPDGNGYCPSDDRDAHSILTQSAFDAGFEALDPSAYRALGRDSTPEPGRAD